MLRKWLLRQVVLLAFLVFLFGDVFMGTGFLCTLLSTALLPLGPSPFANELLSGIWTVVAPAAMMLIPRAGSAVLMEVLAVLAEMPCDSYFGPSVLISGIIQGPDNESGFLVTRYKRYDTLTLSYSAIGTAVFGCMYGYFKFGYGNYGLRMSIALISVRFVSVCFFSIFLTKVILRMYRSARELTVRVKQIISN